MDPNYFYIDWERLFQVLAVVIVIIAFALAYFGGSKASIKLFVDLWKVGNKIKDEEPPEEGDNEGSPKWNHDSINCKDPLGGDDIDDIIVTNYIYFRNKKVK